MPNTPDEELVRRLLAEARHDEPMPADVVARLEGVLDGLAAEERPAHGPVQGPAQGPAPLPRVWDGRRRRRWAVGLVAAAAAVAAIALAPRLSLSSGSSGDGAASSDSAGASSSKSEAVGPVGELHRDTFAADVRRTVRRLRVPGAGVAAPGGAPEAFSCAAADWGPGTPSPVRLDGRAAMLVLRPPVAGRQVADVLECGTARVLASVTVPAR